MRSGSLLTIVVFVAGILLAGAIRSQAQQSYCFKSADGNKLHLQFTLIDKDWQYGYIRYNTPAYGIAIKKKYGHAVASLNNPGLWEYMWEELRNDTVTGTYQFMKQGEAITDIIYTRARDKQQFRFATAGTGIKDCECDW